MSDHDAMAWTLTHDLTNFLATAGDFLHSRPVEHTVLLSSTETLRIRGPHVFGDAQPLFGWWCEGDGAVTGVFMHTPPFPLYLSPMPTTAVPAVIEALDRHGHSFSEAIADQHTIDRFTAAWRDKTGATYRVTKHLRLHRLDTLTPPTPAPPGRARLADEADQALLVEWYDAFCRETGEPSASANLVSDRLSFGGLMLWEVDGVPVSMAGRNRSIAGVIRIAPVYTPPQLRGRGYAGGVTAALSQAALDSGAEVILFTDVANPTSNALYQRLGYRPLGDVITVSLGSGAQTDSD